ncbi:MAG: hypothetical protein AAGD18_23810 [Actinomycetota bacterium]
MFVTAHPSIGGLELRYALVVALVESQRTMSLDELGRTVESWGFEIGGRRGKTISAALRWERRRGRVLQVRRGHDRQGHVPRGSLHRMQRTIANRRAALRRAADPPGHEHWPDVA